MKLLLAGAVVASGSAQAQTPASSPAPAAASASASASAAKPAPKKVVKKKVEKKVAAPVVTDPEAAEPDTSGTVVTDYKCEMGNKLTIFMNKDDEDHIALQWGKRLHRMSRVHTTTGAVRFENHYYGLVWIGIPSKGILLDSKSGHQLANECKSPEQLAAPLEVAAPPVAPPPGTAPALAPSVIPATPPAEPATGDKKE
jgi:hypothetical protein